MQKRYWLWGGIGVGILCLVVFLVDILFFTECIGECAAADSRLSGILSPAILQIGVMLLVGGFAVGALLGSLYGRVARKRQTQG